MPRKFVKINIGGKIRAKALGGLNKLRRPLVSVTGNLVGHRGIAAGSYKKRQAARDRGEEAYTAEEQSRWQNLSRGGVEHFLSGGTFVVNSSNVSTVRYLPDDHKLIVVFHGGKGYEYSNVSLDEARSFAFAKSKGGWVWGHLRVRGSKTAHQKPYRPLFFSEADPTESPSAGPQSKFYAFVHQGQILIVDRGGVSFARYITEERALIVFHQDGQAFEYANIGKDEATAFARAKDKGRWLIEVAHRKPYRRLGTFEPGENDWQW